MYQLNLPLNVTVRVGFTNPVTLTGTREGDTLCVQYSGQTFRRSYEFNKIAPGIWRDGDGNRYHEGGGFEIHEAPRTLATSA